MCGHRYWLSLLLWGCGALFSLKPSITWAQSTSPVQNRNPGIELPWIRHQGNQGVVVFVHGFLGDDTTTWTNKTSYWPKLLMTDSSFDHQDIYVARYNTALWKSVLTIDQVAEQLHVQFSNAGVFGYKEITFVCHSMGGLVVRSLILRDKEQILRKIRFVYFLATPTNGSDIANIVRLLTKNQQISGLVNDANGYLDSQQNSWTNNEMYVKSYCAYETLPSFGLKKVVERMSAGYLCNRRSQAIEADHSDIVKPKTVNDMSHQVLKYAFNQTAQSSPEPSVVRPTVPGQADRVRQTKSGDAPSLQINYPPRDRYAPVDLTSPTAVSFFNIPLSLHPWLVVQGQEGAARYWPLGDCSKDGYSLIESHPRRSLSDGWEGVVQIGSKAKDDEGHEFTLVLVVVEKAEDERLAKVFRGRNCPNSTDEAQDGTRRALKEAAIPASVKRVMVRK